MAYMFSEAKSFNQDIGNWNVGKVTSMYTMFYNAESFNNLGSIFKDGSSLSLWQIYPNINLNEIKSYISDLSKEYLVKVLEDRKPTLDGSAKENFEALKYYKQLVDYISDYANNHNIDLKSLVLRDLSLDPK